MRKLKSAMSNFSRKIAIFLLAVTFVTGAGLAESSVLCRGDDGHLAVETAASCAACGLRTIRAFQPESLTSGGSPTAGCGPCEDFSITSMGGSPGFTALPPPAPGLRDAAPLLTEPAAGSGTVSVFSFPVSGPLATPDPIARHARPVVLLI